MKNRKLLGGAAMCPRGHKKYPVVQRKPLSRFIYSNSIAAIFAMQLLFNGVSDFKRTI